MSFRKNLSIQFGVVGLILGTWGGFIIRDEYYFPSYKRIDDLIKEYYKNDKLLDKEIEELNLKLKELDKKKKAPAQNQAKKSTPAAQNKTPVEPKK